MPKDTPGRNDPCPCGSGKKYKKCCLSKGPLGHVGAAGRPLPEGLAAAQRRNYVERLERWADAARDAVDSGRLDEAERLAGRLIAEYPEQIDGYIVGAMVCVRQERWIKAGQGFEQALAIALKHRTYFDEAFIEALRRDTDHARAHSQRRGDDPGTSTGKPPTGPHGF